MSWKQSWIQLCLITLLSLQTAAALSLLDGDFGAGGGADALIYQLAIQPDERVVAVGAFREFNGEPKAGIVRLNDDGSIDPSFYPSAGANDRIMTVALQADGKIVVAGEFTSVNGIARNRLARLTSDGQIDLSFDPAEGPFDENYNFIYSVAVQPDGKILAGGTFTRFNGQPANRLVRLNPDGSLDNSFNPGTAAEDHWIGAIRLQDDGKILVAGWFTRFNGENRSRIVRLNPDGSTDSTFNAISNSSVYSVAVQPDGRILMGGHFTEVNGAARNRLARLHSDGSLDHSFDPGGGANDWVQVVAPLSDSTIFVAGYFSSFAGKDHRRMVLLNQDGSVNPDFTLNADEYVYAVAVGEGNQVVIGGGFSQIGGTPRGRIARFQLGSQAPPLLAPPVFDGGRKLLRISTQAGSVYTLEFSDSLSNPNWKELSTVEGTGDSETLVDATRGPATRFYRCRIAPMVEATAP